MRGSRLALLRAAAPALFFGFFLLVTALATLPREALWRLLPVVAGRLDLPAMRVYAARAKCSVNPANSPRPSVEPSAASTWFSGWGIKPSTLPELLTTPAIAFVAPLTFQAGSREPSGSV